jgi:hypothetical protein
VSRDDNPFSPANIPEVRRLSDDPPVDLSDGRAPLGHPPPEVIAADDARRAFDAIFHLGIVERADGTKLQMTFGDDGDRLLNGRRSIDWEHADAVALTEAAEGYEGQAERKARAAENAAALDPKTNPFIKLD